MSRKYKFHNKEAAYFISFPTVYWLDVFTRQIYFNVLEESIVILFQGRRLSFQMWKLGYSIAQEVV